MLVFWFGYGGNSNLVEGLRPLVDSLNMRLICIHEHENANIKWNRQTFLSELQKADIIILPTNYEQQPAKSNNRLTQSFALGKPVICSPLPAYLKIYEKFPGCCLIAKTDEDWKKYLRQLRDDKDLRESLSRKALEASKDYSINSIGKQWLDLFDSSEKVDIIIPAYNNVEYLKLCVESIRKNTNGLYNLIISDSGSNDETWEYIQSLGFAIILGRKNVRLNYSQACNAGIKYSKLKYFVILNSDVIVSKNWLTNLKDKMNRQNLAVCGVLSNCDRGWLNGVEGKPIYLMKLDSGLELIPGMKKNQINVEELYNFMEKSNEIHKNIFVEQEWVAYYAAIYNKEIINRVGLLDPGFNNGCEDLDHCRRIKKMGYNIGQAIDSFVFHFGGISRAAYEKSNDKYHEEDVANHAYLKEKWG